MQSVSATFFSACSLSLTRRYESKNTSKILQHTATLAFDKNRSGYAKKGNARKKKKTFYLFMLFLHLFLSRATQLLHIEIHYYLL
jgi:hypothetical protein